MRRLAVGLVALSWFLAPGAATAEAYTPGDTYAAIDAAAHAYRVPAGRLSAIVSCETGGTMRPDLVGDHGTSFGAVQLHRGGLLEFFHSLGYGSAFDPYEAVDFLARVMAGLYAEKGITLALWSCAGSAGS
jgi:hypothetical protein